MDGITTPNPIPAEDIGTSNCGDAAVKLFQEGWEPIPIRPGTKTPAVKWERWRRVMSARNIRRYYAKHPDHEVAVILGPDTIVFDADTPEGVINLYMLWESLDIKPNLIVGTDRGEHHYFRRASETFAKSDAQDKTGHPERFDVKTGNAIAIVPPSAGKRYLLNEATSADDLVVIAQRVIDAVYRHNGRDAPRPPVEQIVLRMVAGGEEEQLVADIQYLLSFLEPDGGYNDWVAVGMAIHHEFGGSDTGFELFHTWSSEGNKYPGRQEVLAKWLSMSGFTGTPVTLGTLCRLAAANGADLERLNGECFAVIDDDELQTLPEHELRQFSLRGLSGQFEADMQAQRFVLEGIALVGQWTLIYAPPNKGKTLLVIWLSIQGIVSGGIDPECLFYINADDNYQGLTTKLKLAEKHGFHMLAPGHRDFRVKNFLDLLRKLCKANQARRTLIILDTLKKFVSLMDKRTAADFGTAIREFVSKGGTLVALAHCNKKRGDDGKPVYSGVADFVDDADAAFVMDAISDKDDIRTVEFENIKSRGMVKKRVTYGYSSAEGLGYNQILESVFLVDDATAEQLRVAADAFDEQDATLIQAIEACIQGGTDSKMKLLAEVTASTGASRRQVERVIDKYCGDDELIHHWRFTRGARGLTTYTLLHEADNPLNGEDLDDLDVADMEGPY